jgi:vacuolar-type H+-ATPase subunit E/Vma4
VTATSARSEEVLRDEILAGARRQAEERLSRAKADAEALLVKTEADAAKEKAEKLQSARTAAQTLSEQIMGRLPVDVGRMRSARVETLLESVHAEVRRRVVAREGFDYRQAVIALVARAVARMEGSRFVLSLSETDQNVLREWPWSKDGVVSLPEPGVDPDKRWRGEVQRRTGRKGLELTLAPEPAKVAGGVVVRDAEGRQMCDDSLESRLARFLPAARREIAVQTGVIPTSGAREEK